MAKIRAYKLAEELGIDRHEFVAKAAEAGIELKSAMAGLDEEAVRILREKLGEPSRTRRQMVESRVERSGGTTVLRRRKRVEADSSDDATPEPTLLSDPLAESTVELQAVESVEGDGEEVAGEESAEAAAGVEDPQASPSVVEEVTGDAPDRRSGTAERPETAAAPAGPERKGRQRKRVREVVNLQEQERFARQITGRGPAARRSSDASTRAMVSPRRKRRDKLAARPAVSAATDQTKVVKIAGEISVGEFAKLVGAKAPALQGKL
ncbi:MAG: translation initiation factor IF-2 N-terminal domain-containing protein, partial [Myxococcota bacterium]